jgi:hypothetical protein
MDARVHVPNLTCNNGRTSTPLVLAAQEPGHHRIPALPPLVHAELPLLDANAYATGAIQLLRAHGHHREPT